MNITVQQVEVVVTTSLGSAAHKVNKWYMYYCMINAPYIIILCFTFASAYYCLLEMLRSMTSILALNPLTAVRRESG